MTCSITVADRRRKFWATKESACGDAPSCNVACGRPGLQPIDTGQGRTFSTDDYVRGLALNILLTNGRKRDTICGTSAGTRGGHWADAFRTDGGSSGSLIRQVKPSGRINENVAEIQAAAQRDLDKLVIYQVATSVVVEARYAGRNTVDLTATITGQDGRTTAVAVTGSRLENSWVWN